jgi:uncharacterized FAD-dependent dehydrogenase
LIKEIEIAVSPGVSNDAEQLKSFVASFLNFDVKEINEVEILRRSIDARRRDIKVLLKVIIYTGQDKPNPKEITNPPFKSVATSKSVIIVGAGPAGLFAALKLLQKGIKPIIIERGKTVRDRRRDLAAINREQIVNPDSNYCFGEGGAGTYSDGKLYTRSTKRGDVNEVLNLLIANGADESIGIDAHPHIGTNKLPKIIENIRNVIIDNGGEVHFNTKLVDFTVKEDKVTDVTVVDVLTNDHSQMQADAIILATGHSARDIFELLNKKGITVESKSFAMGVRIEHPQELIDSIQYHCPVERVSDLRENLPAASYSLVQQVDGKGVYSFCMCPGGIIAPCATAQNEIVTNGWSPSKRNNPYANSGTVVSLDEKDWQKYLKHGPLAALRYQQALEYDAWIAGGKTQVAPAQRLVDFADGRISRDLPGCSYQPGIASAPLHNVLFPEIASRLRKAVKLFGKKMKGYYSNDAVVVGVESRTSSPIRIPRDKETLAHPQLSNLFPCGEGAGYAGGIVSAAIDGMRCAEAVAGKI